MSIPLDVLPAYSRELIRLLRGTLAGSRPAPPSDWQTALRLATWHGVDAFLYPSLAGQCTEPPPGDELARWRQHSLSAAATAVRREAQTRELLAMLTDAHVRVVPLKGIWLAARVYAEPGQRAMDDIDILAPPAELARARDVLARLGYMPQGRAVSADLDCNQTFTSPDHACPVELHWHLGVAGQPPLHRPAIPGLWQRLAPERLLDVPVAALSPAEHLVYLAYHVLHHRFALPLRGYLDLVLLAQSLGESPDRRQLDAIASEWGMSHALPRVMAVAYGLFDRQPPPALADWMSADEQVQREQTARIILESSAQRTLPAERTLMDFQRRRPLARLGLLLQRIFMPREYLRREYPFARAWIGMPIAYAQRAWHLARLQRSGIWSILRRDAAVTHRLDQAAERTRLVAWFLQGAPEQAPTTAPATPGTARPSA